MSLSKFTEEQVTTGLMALIAWAGNAAAASRALKADKGLDIPSVTLNSWAKDVYAPRYAEMREKYAEQMETELVHEYRDVARQAVEVQRKALDRAMYELSCNNDRDPARTAANAARVAQSMTDKMLALSGRPTSIREDRNLQEIMRSLVAKGILQLPEGEVVEETADAA